MLDPDVEEGLGLDCFLGVAPVFPVGTSVVHIFYHLHLHLHVYLRVPLFYLYITSKEFNTPYSSKPIGTPT